MLARFGWQKWHYVQKNVYFLNDCNDDLVNFANTFFCHHHGWQVKHLTKWWGWPRLGPFWIRRCHLIFFFFFKHILKEVPTEIQTYYLSTNSSHANFRFFVKTLMLLWFKSSDRYQMKDMQILHSMAYLDFWYSSFYLINE